MISKNIKNNSILIGKRIAYVIESFNPGITPLGGAGIITQSIAHEILKQDVNLKVIVDSYSPQAPKKIKSWNREDLDVYQFPLLKCMPKGVHFFGRTRRKYIIAKLNFNNILKLTKPDIVHIHSHPDGLVRLALEFKKKTKAKIIFTTHGLDPKFNKYPHYKDVPYFPKWIEAVESVDFWVPCGPVDQKGLIKWGISEEKILPIYNGVEVPESLPEMRNGDKNKEFRITYVGRMIKRKGIFDLAEAMVEVVKGEKNKNFILTMVGAYSNEILKKLQKILEPVSDKLKYEFLGELPNKKIKNILLSSNIFCYPTKSPWEGLPLSILEAGAYGCPMVLSDHYAHLAIYKPNVHAKFFKMSDKEQLTKALLEMINDKEKRIFFIENAYRLIKERFNIREMLKRYMKLYHLVLK